MPQPFSALTTQQQERAIQKEARTILRMLGWGVRGRSPEPLGPAVQDAVDRIRAIAANRAQAKEYALPAERGYVDPGEV
jgi:hypothetical protein